MLCFLRLLHLVPCWLHNHRLHKHRRAGHHRSIHANNLRLWSLSSSRCACRNLAVWLSSLVGDFRLRNWLFLRAVCVLVLLSRVIAYFDFLALLHLRVLRLMSFLIELTLQAVEGTLCIMGLLGGHFNDVVHKWLLGGLGRLDEAGFLGGRQPAW